MDSANDDAARDADRMSSRADDRTTGGVNTIEPQPRNIPSGLRGTLGRVVLLALIVAALIIMIYQLTSAS
jgi:hypothetical protein